MKRQPLAPTDPMPWGQFAGTPIGQLPMDYLDFLLRQPWLQDWPSVYAYVKSREAEIVKARPQLQTPKILQSFDDYLKWARR